MSFHKLEFSKETGLYHTYQLQGLFQILFLERRETEIPVKARLATECLLVQSLVIHCNVSGPSI